ncbi:CASP-like protein 1E1 [Actinidia eriantha]|uniref:CASP-like protein 1E1 n=1 Tax=Actinidia eriantha TaxID=165200 RepID=UPI00258A029C|nr:CASP-like protein 1E1 [Actinidia eriantha]
MGLVFTFVAAVVCGVDKETRTVAITIVDTLPPLHIPVTAKWHYMSALVYFVVSNAIACTYAAASLGLSITTASTTQNNTTLALLILDLVMVALLFSANGAVAGVGVISLNGNSHVKWTKVCNVVTGFCRRSTAAFVMSILGSFVFLSLAVIGTLKLHKKAR